MARPLPPRARGRVPGHQPRAVRAGQPARGRAPQRGGGRRRRPVDLPLPRRRRAQHPRLPQGLSGRARGPPGAELPLEPGHPRRRLQRHPQQPGARREEAVDRARRRREGVRDAGLQRGRGGGVRRRRDRAPAQDGEARLLGLRGPLSHQRAVPLLRGRARAPPHPLPARRRRPLLGAPRGQGRRRLPALLLQPPRRAELRAHRVGAAAQDRQRHRRRAERLRARHGGGPAGRARRPGARAQPAARRPSTRCRSSARSSSRCGR